MPVVFAVIGLVLGAMTGSFAGALAFAALGYAIGLHITFKQRIDELEHGIELVRLACERRDVGDPEPAPARIPEPRVAPVYQRGDPPVPDPAAPAPAPRPAPPLEPRRHAAVPQASPPRALFEESPPAPREWQRPHQRSADDEELPRAFTWIRDWFFGGNIVVRIGVVVLFIGVGFLLKFAVDRNMLPIEFRLAGAALGGAALLIIGWRLRLRLRPYALALQGGGVGLLYLTAFAALRFYDLLPPTVTFAMLVAIAVLSSFLAVGQNALVLAVLGALGGYLAPILTSTDQGNHVVLFSYYALLDAGIVAIAWFKAWRPLNLMAFVFTYGIGTAWGVLRYAPENFASTEPFVVLFFLMFLAVAVLFALRTAPRLTDYVDGTLVFGTPVVTMMLQSALLQGRPYAMSFSALALAAVYLLLARSVWRRGGEQLRLLAESFLALGVAFVTLAVPLALDGHWTAGTWALEGAAIFWIGLRQQRGLAIASGLLLQVGAAIAFGIGDDVVPARLPVVNSGFACALLIAAGGFVTARVAHTHRGQLPRDFGWLTAVSLYWALIWWGFAGYSEIFEYVAEPRLLAASLAFAVPTVLGCAVLSRWGDWREARPLTVLLLPAMAVAAAWGFARDGHLLVNAGWLVWPLAFAAWFWLLRWRRHDASAVVDPGLHLLTLWFTVAIVAFELAWQVESLKLGDAAWHRIVSGLVPALALAAVLARTVRARWPVGALPGAYLGIGAGGLAIYLWSWTLFMIFDDASALPLPYLPLVNPVELTQCFALVTAGSWLLYLWRQAPRDWVTADRRPAVVAIAVAVFALLNAVLLRTIHHYAGVPYDVEDLVESTLVQAALSVFWGVLALGSMVHGTRRAQRTIWFVGAWLLGITLIKMFLVDLSRSGTAARIVSFICVGVLMLIIGRFSPVPPDESGPETAR